MAFEDVLSGAEEQRRIAEQSRHDAQLALWEAENGKAKVGDLGRRLYLDCGTLTPLLKKMEESGWLTRCRCKVDERVVYVSLTGEGWALREQLKTIPEQVGRCMTMEKEDAAQLYTLLHRLLETM